MDLNDYHARVRAKGVNPIVYWLMRAWLQPFAHLYWRLSRIGREHVPQSGPVIFVSNHRSFIDPFILGLCNRRPVYYVAKEELFKFRPLGWFLCALGAFPVRRGAADADMIETAKAILKRGDPVLIFPEGTRIRPGALGKPKRGVGRLALETGATVVPVAMRGTETIRRGILIRPCKIHVRIGAPLKFPQVESATAQLAAAVTDRIWPNVMLQWEWLGGLPPLRRAAIIGDAGTELAVALARAGIDVDLTGGALPAREQLELPQKVRPREASELELSEHDLVVFAMPAAELPAALEAHAGRITKRSGVLVLSRGLVPPLGALPGSYVATRTAAWATAVLGGHVENAELVLATRDEAFGRQLADALRAARLKTTRTKDVVGVELATCAQEAAALAVATAGPDAAGTAAERVLAEVGAYARREGSKRSIKSDPLAQPDEASIALLVGRLRQAGIDAPVLDGLAGVLEGRVEPERWAASLSEAQAA
jgi:glycerol-3-phosphate dehydrogenase (NAD(P)+)